MKPVTRCEHDETRHSAGLASFGRGGDGGGPISGIPTLWTSTPAQDPRLVERARSRLGDRGCLTSRGETTPSPSFHLVPPRTRSSLTGPIHPRERRITSESCRSLRSMYPTGIGPSMRSSPRSSAARARAEPCRATPACSVTASGEPASRLTGSSSRRGDRLSWFKRRMPATSKLGASSSHPTTRQQRSTRPSIPS